MSHSIPKKIIQTGRTFEQPLRNRAMINAMRLLNPDFEYVFFDEEKVQSFIDREFPQYRPVFDSFPFPIQRYDFFRYLAVYLFGGFYFDLDVLLVSGLSDLVNSQCVFPFESLTLSHFLRTRYKIDWEIGNYAFGAEAGSPFLEAVIENCIKARRDQGWVKPMMTGFPRILREEYLVLNTTGPGLVTRTLMENPEIAKSVRILFPEDLSDMKSWNCFGDFGVHLMEGSWRTKGAFLRRKLANYWESWKVQRVAKKYVETRKNKELALAANSLEPRG